MVMTNTPICTAGQAYAQIAGIRNPSGYGAVTRATGARKPQIGYRVLTSTLVNPLIVSMP